LAGVADEAQTQAAADSAVRRFGGLWTLSDAAHTNDDESSTSNATTKCRQDDDHTEIRLAEIVTTSA
jgi:hypothetical protein